jgi:hypothetical protein
VKGDALVFADGNRYLEARGPGGGIVTWSGKKVPASSNLGVRAFACSKDPDALDHLAAWTQSPAHEIAALGSPPPLFCTGRSASVRKSPEAVRGGRSLHPT